MLSTIYILGVIVWMLGSTISNLKDRRYDVGVVTLSIILGSLLWPIGIIWFFIATTLKWGRGE